MENREEVIGTLSVVNYNICGLKNKVSEPVFLEFIAKYDLIILLKSFIKRSVSLFLVSCLISRCTLILLSALLFFEEKFFQLINFLVLNNTDFETKEDLAYIKLRPTVHDNVTFFSNLPKF